MKIITPLFLSIALLGSQLSVSPMNAQVSVARKSSPYNDLIVNAGRFKTFRDLQIASESKAVSYIQQAFKSNASQVFLQVLGDRNGLISPILTISVSNSQWRSQPKIQTWAKYYPVSVFLLGYSIRPTPDVVATPVAIPVSPTTKPESKPATIPPKIINITAPLNPPPLTSPNTAPTNATSSGLPEVQNPPGFRDD
jgi:hypothetical protein